MLGPQLQALSRGGVYASRVYSIMALLTHVQSQRSIDPSSALLGVKFAGGQIRRGVV